MATVTSGLGLDVTAELAAVDGEGGAEAVFCGIGVGGHDEF